LSGGAGCHLDQFGPLHYDILDQHRNRFKPERRSSVTTARVGATKKYVQNWERAFARKKAGAAAKKATPATGRVGKKK
jgi:hypothetical protein